MIRQLSNLKYVRSWNAGHLKDIHFLRLVNGWVKRGFDVLGAIFGLLILAPIFLYIIFQIKHDSPGPVFYWGPRAGRRGRLFKILKFRTMYECKQSYKGPRITCKADSRITPIGHWLRNTKINELPQLWNVLIGEMSFVGPRPEDPEIAKSWPADARIEILSVRPGLTSPASILYHDEEALLSKSNMMGNYLKSIMPDKMRLDRLYVRNHSFFSDLDIIFWTIAILLPRVVKTRIPEGYLFAGPLSRFVDRYVTWFLTDLFVTFGSVVTAMLLWRVEEPLNWGAGNLIILSAGMAVLFSGINAIAGLNRIVWNEAFTEDASGLMISAIFTTLVTLTLNALQAFYHWLPYPALPIQMIFEIGLMASIGFIVVRYRWRLLTGFASRWLHWRNDQGIAERVLIVGSGDGIQLSNWLLTHGEASRVFAIVGFVDDEQPAMQGMQVKGSPLLGGLADIPSIIERYDIGVVLFAIPNAASEIQNTILNLCHRANVRMVFLFDLLATLQKQLTLPRNKRKYR